ncbi:TIGR03086 family metal-binding protein [Kibdelosporangium persicum]|uniref:Mycothiol maleylpyruvate isomerase N-terminal domain n=1 Tax=Kibdelosporangium persicum TaxID=2698649 RepID=A0ABX2EYY4_9PSEU|nr:TIGR03086 family metal-binding protein [Kibdelosporangium persicum]NRN63885.1 Mycothiol maleylpyruvate isomerase N-terminal domain [Kibdelosporangium persicum]
MSGNQLFKYATAPVIDVVDGIRPDQLGAPTPCSEFDVRKLLNHLLYWGPSLEGAAHKQTVPPPVTPESEVDIPDDWRPKLVAQLAKLTESWSEQAAWEGTTHMGGPTELPAAMVGGMVVGEIVIHGTDLARATGQPIEFDEDLLAFVHKEVEAGVEWGRDMGVYGPEVPVPADAPLLDRILGLTGRNPS